jgi:hypothetical protein
VKRRQSCARDNRAVVAAVLDRSVDVGATGVRPVVRRVPRRRRNAWRGRDGDDGCGRSAVSRAACERRDRSGKQASSEHPDQPCAHCCCQSAAARRQWLAQGIPRAAMSPAASGGRTVEPVTEEDF